MLIAVIHLAASRMFLVGRILLPQEKEYGRARHNYDDDETDDESNET